MPVISSRIVNGKVIEFVDRANLHIPKAGFVHSAYVFGI